MDNINLLVNEKMSKRDKGINYIALINKPSDKKVSFVMECKDKKECYFGLSPKFKTHEIGKQIQNDTLSNPEKLDEYIKTNIDYFKIEKIKRYCKELKTATKVSIKPEDMLQALFAKTILQVSMHYGFVIHIPSALIFDKLDEAFSIIKEECNTETYDALCHYKIDKDDKVLYIKGRPCDKSIEIMDYMFALVIKDNVLEIKEKHSDEKCNFKSIFSQDDSINTLKAKVCISDKNEYYSGVLPRLISIEEMDQSVYNTNVESYVLNVERSTYAYCDAFNHNKVINEPVMEKYKDIILAINKYEIMLENTFTEFDFSNDNPKDYMKVINEYLDRTLNPNNIAVSSNLITSDEYLLMGLRSKASIDANTLYCSFNGQSEIADKNVGFYRESAFEDYPSLSLESDRIDFKNEFTRECIAELAIPGFDTNYNYYGLSILGRKRNINNPEEDGRVHFNILANHISAYSFKDVQKRWKNAVESFENQYIVGIGVKYRTRIRNNICNFFKWISEKLSKSKSIILLIATLIAIVGNIITTNTVENVGLLKILDWTFTVIITITTTCLLIHSIKESDLNLKTRKRFFRRKSYENEYYRLTKKTTNKFIKLIKKSNDYSINKENFISPIASLMLALYLRDKKIENIQKNEKKKRKK